MWCVYFLVCVLRPICVPAPETAVALWGTRQIGSLGAFFLGGGIGSVLGLMIMYSLSSLIAYRIAKGRKERRQIAWFKQLTGRRRVWILGALLIVPLVSDKALCAGSAFLKIPLPQFLKIGIIAKIISIGMIAFSGFFGDLCGLRRWQMIAVELLFLFLASTALQHFCKKGEAKLS
ncbi:MAG: hypothetical protein HFH32_18810 [Eubacterium sp.]|jgi:membrane protein YqaA with SNARE-associated domain|nr:hypothetical protein [Eubacterium sp.]